ncbi:hypothetical protein ETB97_006348 [Aspergillus alliaceus]|uniref:Uncharacterized protein n=1 Tax=Petromyces alliaceus TaxID=209559 RepID=A0A8H6EBJ2_PETAA|nr:hypothetical protein ETB97_006348 [Aspergillus burnettii]
MDADTTPFPAQLALALAIVKQKPADLDIKEYILQIRQNIKATKDADKTYTQDKDKFFDSVSFWQQAYEKSEAEQSKLLDRIYDLERRNEALNAKIQARDATFGDESVLIPSKRKATVGKKAAMTRKRAKTQVGHLGNGNGHALRVGDELGSVDYVEESTGSFMRQFYTLQKALQKRGTGSAVVQAAVNLCTTAADEISKAGYENRMVSSVAKKGGSVGAEKPGIVEVIRGVGGAFKLLLRAIKALSGAENGTRYVNHVIYHVIHLYESTMNSLEQRCKVKSEQAHSTPSAKKKQAMSHRQAKDVQPSDTIVKTDDEVSVQITQLLSTMASALDPASSEHQNLLEGFLYLLISRVGKLLCLFVFQDLQLRPELCTDSTKLPLPRGLTEVDLNDKTFYAANIEAKYLVWLLERTLAVTTRLVSLSPSESRDSRRSVSFEAKLKERLQSTLLQAVFGRESIWGQSFHQPTQTGGDLDGLQTCPPIPDQSVPDWFMQEVWRLLGWDILVNCNPSNR